MSMDFENDNASGLRPLAVVTGGSKGIGFELAREFAEHGYDLVICAEDVGVLGEAAQALSGLGPDAGSQVRTVSADLSTYEGVEQLAGELQALGRPIDVLAANAGVGVGGDFARETDLDDELHMIELNVSGQVHLIKRVVREMVERDRGQILITSSIAGVLPGPREAVYAATKAFLRSFGHALRNELSDTGVGVTVLMPGPTETEFFERAGLEDTRAGQMNKDDPAMVAKAAFHALEHDRAQVVAGVKNKVQVGMAAAMPDTAKAAFHGEMTKPAKE
ncbi:SDR family NAD(P)-dependent oxidoreductase [Phenylobacterium sp. VNQ135]|uniref:SDR family NAD(P)-dependent oxidoreductase n=1 Tax=Phenylobacterium sp. VNQ135 TaxID=3400922 RepID=UPI003C0ECF96